MEQVFWAKGAYVAGAVAGVTAVVQAKDDPTVLVIEHGSGCVRSPENCSSDFGNSSTTTGSISCCRLYQDQLKSATLRNENTMVLFLWNLTQELRVHEDRRRLIGHGIIQQRKEQLPLQVRLQSTM